MSDTSPGSSGVDLPNSPLEHMRMRSESGSRPGSTEEAVVDRHEPLHCIVPKASSTGIWIVRDESGEAEGTCICAPRCGQFPGHLWGHQSIGRLSSVLKARACLNWQSSGPMDTQEVLHMPRQLHRYHPPYPWTQQPNPKPKNFCSVPIVFHLQITLSCILAYIILPSYTRYTFASKIVIAWSFFAHIVQLLFRIYTQCPSLLWASFGAVRHFQYK